MGFNYLQTDDRDDYFKQFGSKGKPKVDKRFTLKDSSGKTILFNVESLKIRKYSKRYWEKGKAGEKWKWRQMLFDRGYTITREFLTPQTNKQ